ncbi:MAG TPA: hypothetical protein VE569_01150 [Acidimicrobiia bacterium]|nr:hypothetical protein [Acidimicrobiia bacterium]
MDDRQLELIAALAEGRLEDETAARALLATSAEARAEYEAQKTALEALAATSTVALTETEKAALHRDVWAELRTPVSTPSSTVRWYSRWAPVAAVLLVVVGLVAVISQSGLLGGAESADTASEAKDAASVTTAAAGMDESADAAQGGAIAEESAAPEATAGETREEQALRALTDAEIDFYRAEAERLRFANEADDVESSTHAGAVSDLEACLDTAELDGYEVYHVNKEEIYIAAIPKGVDVEAAPIAFVNPETCELIYIDE